MTKTIDSKTAVYVDTGTLANWSSHMQNINEQAITILDNFTSTVAELENYWVGNSATGFLNASKGLMNDAKRQHENMQDISSFLKEVAITV